MPRDLCQLAYREVGLLLAGAPLAEGYVLDRHHRWTPARIVRTATHLARSQPLGHLSHEILLCLVQDSVLCCRTNSYLFIDTRYVARSCSLEHYERGVTQGSLQPSPRLRLRSRDQRGRLRRRACALAPNLSSSSPRTVLMIIRSAAFLNEGFAQASNVAITAWYS